MDVSAAAGVNSALAPGQPSVAPISSGAVPAPTPAPAPTPTPTPAPGPSPDLTGQPQSQKHHDASLIGAVGKLFGQPDQPHSVSLNVSYRVEHNPNEIVTVFTDPNTGKEVAQFPAEIVVQIAEFFDKHSGVTLDQSA